MGSCCSEFERGGARGGRGRGGRGRGVPAAVDKGRRREKDHHVSGTGRDGAPPKHGAGKGNWGTGCVSLLLLFDWPGLFEGNCRGVVCFVCCASALSQLLSKNRWPLFLLRAPPLLRVRLHQSQKLRLSLRRLTTR